MQKSIFSATIIGLFVSMMSLNAQKANNEIGLKVENIRPKTATFTSAKSTKTGVPQLNLPKVNDPLVRIQQNVFYSQHRYPQSYLHRNNTTYYELMDRQLISTQSQRELFIDRAINVALIKLFKLD
jgi:hypothetical protein